MDAGINILEERLKDKALKTNDGHFPQESCLGKIYEEYLEALQCQVKLTVPLHEQVAQQFLITVQYFHNLQCCSRETGFQTREQEIRYFKHIKPLFTSRIELYTLKFKGLLFAPSDPVDALDYWQCEMEKLPSYTRSHLDFINYYDEGHTHYDGLYFVSSKLSDLPTAWRTPYDVEDNYSSTHDGLVAGLLAHRAYHLFASEQHHMISCSLLTMNACDA